MSHRVKILACSTSHSLANQIAKSYGESLADVELKGLVMVNSEYQLKKLLEVVMYSYSKYYLLKKILWNASYDRCRKRASAHKIVAVSILWLGKTRS